MENSVSPGISCGILVLSGDPHPHSAISTVPNVRLAYLYGSFLAREDFRDIDIALYLDEDPADDRQGSYAERIGIALEEARSFCHACDIRILNHSPVWFQYEVISSGLLLYARSDEERFEHETSVLIANQDMKCTCDLFDSGYLARAWIMRMLSQLQAWERYREIPYEECAREKDVRYMVCHAMLLAIQSAIDIATGIAVKKTPKRPDTCRETFLILGRSALIPEDIATELSTLAGFQNLLVHEYAALDHERVYRILQGDWQTLVAVRHTVRDFLKENP